MSQMVGVERLEEMASGLLQVKSRCARHGFIYLTGGQDNPFPVPGAQPILQACTAGGPD